MIGFSGDYDMLSEVLETFRRQNRYKDFRAILVCHQWKMALRRVTEAKALRRVTEGKASAQAEAAEWKCKYEPERARNLLLEQSKYELERPLGQGVANAVGLALAEKHLAARYKKPDSEIVDHYTQVCYPDDGCQMEGISNEACSLAGHWGLGKLIAFYDDNHISIDGETEIAFSESVDSRFEGLGWLVIWVKNGNTGYDAAIKEAKVVKDKPTLIKDLFHMFRNGILNGDPIQIYMKESYLPGETPASLAHFRKQELLTLRGDGSGELQTACITSSIASRMFLSCTKRINWHGGQMKNLQEKC